MGLSAERKEQLNELLALFAGTFPNKLTVEQRALAAQDFLRFRRSTVEAAIREHARRFDWPNYPELLRAFEAAEREKDLRSSEAVPAQSFADIARRTIPQLAGVKSDVEVVLRKHRQWWHQCSKSGAYRSRFASSCKHQLYAVMCAEVVGLRRRELSSEEAAEKLATAEAWANPIFETPEAFRLALADLRGELCVPAEVSAALE